MTLENLLSELSAKMGLPALRLNSHGMVRLVFDKNVAVDIEAPRHSPVFHLVTVLGGIPSEGREALFTKLLEANVFGHASGGAVISVDPDAGEIYLHRSFDRYSTEPEYFINAFASFIDAAEEWRIRLTQHESAPADDNGGINPSVMGSRGFIRA